MKKSPLHKLNSAPLLCAFAAWLAWPAPAAAAPKTWTGAVDASWVTGGNWTPSALSATGDGVVYDASSTANLAQSLGQYWGSTGLTAGAVPGPVTISGAFTVTNWVNVPDSENVTSVTLTIDPMQGAVFFRLRHP